MTLPLKELVAAELAEPVDPRVTRMAAALAVLHPGAARAVLFYGSCLREAKLDGLMLDFYLIVSDYRAAYDRRWLAVANRLIPPNVFPFARDGLSAKYAVLSEEDFARLCGEGADNVSVWARFAQPSRLVWTADEKAQQSAIAAISSTPVTLARLALPGLPAGTPMDFRALFDHAFSSTYRAELRSERAGKAVSIVDSDPTYYSALFDALHRDGALDRTGLPGPRENARRWRRLQRRGKWLSVVRLAKASFTFAGGIDYLAWKINRHAGTRIVITPWQRRHPLLAAMVLLPRLLASRAVG
ncbi:MAG: hypothetical protein AB7U35_06795 [Sphingobium sp.]